MAQEPSHEKVPPAAAAARDPGPSTSTLSSGQGKSEQNDVLVANDTPRPKRYREESESGPEGQYQYVPKCDYCKDRGFTCRTVQSRQRCDVCKAKKVRCSALHGEHGIVKLYKDSGVEKACPAQRTLVDMFRAQGTGPAACPPPSKRQRMFVDVPLASVTQGEQAAVAGRAADSLASPPRSTTATSATTIHTLAHTPPVLTPTTMPTPDTTTTPRPVMVDKGVGTESQPSEHRDAEFMKAFRTWLKGEREGNA